MLNIIKIIPHIASTNMEINNPAASYLATRSGVLQLPVQTLRNGNRKVSGAIWFVLLENG